MAEYLLDTNAVSDLLRANREIEAKLSSLSPTDRVFTCTIVRGEVLFGLAKMAAGARRDALESNALTLFQRIPCDPIKPEVADIYARIKRTRQIVGTSLDENDLWIAATAVHLSAVLVTRDKDFEGTPGLGIQNWTA